ncbi:gliding motility associated protein GldL [Psychroflexus torquis ATCC 700755]|uniref:Gliding motility associated protein GldL n=1 Tax=Psychroflexus torquis (strain ATCC 700755 / CIP 106069 / ACAM 623) TaxID=313595 RepID=K4IBZ1_PSYTT|nr:gliding motility protein GldL [Psychroflexus torquis]AFU67944.1 gliding motility associated protein GldL [Psychroflexus torquis ATCC 700755]
MANSNKRKKVMSMVYGLGAAIVIIGALFKIQHISIGPITGGLMLTIGLITEAVIFTISAFEPVDKELDWEKVYPELTGNNPSSKNPKQDLKEESGLLSQKLDDMLKEAKIDSKLMESLGESIKNFEGAAKNIAPTTDSMNSQKKYGDQISMAAQQMESLNNLYKVQVDSAMRQAEVNEAVTNNAGKLKDQMESLTANLNSLNGVYGGMLTAMRPKA